MLKRVICIGLVISSMPLFSKKYGADTTFNTFDVKISLGNKDIINYGAAIRAGFDVKNNSDVSFQSFFPVHGPISFEGGTWDFQSDFITLNGTDFTKLGNINGNKHRLCVANSVETFPSGAADVANFTDLYLDFLGNVVIGDTTVTWSGESGFDGHFNTIILSADAQFIVDTDATLTIKNCVLKGLSGTNISLAAATSKIIFENVELVLSNDFMFSQGSFDVVGQNFISGFDYSFFYQTTQESQIKKNSSLQINQDVTFVYDPSNSGTLLVTFEDESSQLILKNGTLFTPNTRWDLQNGEFVVKGTSYLNSGVVGDYGFAFGDGISSIANMAIRITQDAVLEVVSGSVKYANV